MLNPDENFEDFVDVAGLQFDYEQYTQRWLNFWCSSRGTPLAGLSLCGWTELKSGKKLVNYMDFIQIYYSLFESELGPKGYNFLTLAQQRYQEQIKNEIDKVMSATPCRIDPLSKRSKCNKFKKKGGQWV